MSASIYPVLVCTHTRLHAAQTSAGSRVAHTPAIIERIVAWIPYVDIHAVSTLLGLQQVSRAFLQAARVDPVWNPLLRRDFCNHQGPVIPTKLPINSPSLQDAVDEIISEQVSTVWQVSLTAVMESSMRSLIQPCSAGVQAEETFEPHRTRATGEPRTLDSP